MSEKSERKTGYTYSEFLQKFSPNGGLNRLHESLKELLNIQQDWQHDFRPNKEEPKYGSSVVAKMDWHGLKEIRQHVIAHYQLEGYTVTESGSALRLSREDGGLYVIFLEAATNFTIVVSADPLEIR